MWAVFEAFAAFIEGWPTRLACVAVAVLCFPLAWRLRRFITQFASKPIELAGTFAWTPFAAVIAAQVAIYLISPVHWDHGHATVAALGAAMLNGQAPYSGFGVADAFHNLPYGPLIFQIQSAVLAISPTVLASKIPGALGFLAGAGALAALARHSPPLLASALACMVGFVAIKNGFPFGVQSEAYLFAIAAVAHLLAMKANSTRSALIIGLLAGLASGVKLYGCLFLAPAAFALLARTTSWPIFLQRGAAILAGGLVTLLAPFAAPNLNLEAYVEQLSESAGVGFWSVLIAENTLEVLLMLAPAATLTWMHRKSLSRDEMGFWLGLAVVAPILVVISSKHGSGPISLFPLAPACFALALLIARRPVSHGDEDQDMATPRVLLAAAMAGALALSPFFVVRGVQLILQARVAGDERALVAEARGLYARFPEAEMGFGGDADYHLTYVRVQDQMMGGRMQVDLAGWMEFAFIDQKTADEKSLAWVRKCHIATWILPKAEPAFTAHNRYDADEIFSSEFRRAFDASHELVAETQHFAVWACRRT